MKDMNRMFESVRRIQEIKGSNGMFESARRIQGMKCRNDMLESTRQIQIIERSFKPVMCRCSRNPLLGVRMNDGL
ncbi:hypothetical protein Hanom_Chr16g01437221 [Helianthus anomalus]